MTPTRKVHSPRPPRIRTISGTAMAARSANYGIPAREMAMRKADDSLLEAIQSAQAGDDFDLLPYQPTPSIEPPRPRTRAAGYDSKSETLRIRFRDGTVYGYYGVPGRVWRNFKRVKSPGRFINRTLNAYPYAREDV